MEETKQLTLPVSGKEAVIKGYMTRKVDQEVQRILLGKNKTRYESEVIPSGDNNVTATSKNMKSVMEVDPTVSIDADDKKLELMVISIDGSTTDIPTQIQNLPSDDATYILDQINAVEDTSKVVASDPKAPSA